MTNVFPEEVKTTLVVAIAGGNLMVTGKSESAHNCVNKSDKLSEGSRDFNNRKELFKSGYDGQKCAHLLAQGVIFCFSRTESDSGLKLALPKQRATAEFDEITRPSFSTARVVI